MKFTNGKFTGTYNQCRDYLGASIPREHPENWPDGPWEVVEPEPVVHVPTTEQLLYTLEEARKAAEDQGVTINGIRHSGAASNRQALNEALQAAAEFELAEFASWKDSDGAYHPNVPVTDVHSALRQIGLRRMNLIAQEGAYAQQIQSGAITTYAEIEALEWDA
ncbi:hypothetical protein CFI10_07040 [Marinobacterium iners]|uniref:DUF4376 domain-containing protein n=1 Tax=Marinobacterium iners TaxID=48076 RepID=UPI001A8F6650|nr:hypothetical protein [Marinobacterium iners]QSR34752.1 hypothetical protein CFI10_07040 [Marinobacterium iners]